GRPASRWTRPMGGAASYEAFLAPARLFGQEQMFLIGTRVLSGTLAAREAGEAFASLADVVVRALHGAVAAQFAAAYGRLAGQASAGLALGKLGGRGRAAAAALRRSHGYGVGPAP